MMQAAVPEYHSDAWLKANGHDRDWLERWLAEPFVDYFAVKTWMAKHKNSDPRLQIKRRVCEP